MSAFIAEPGTRLGGRYRLEDRVSASSGWAAWKAIDETLARPVAALTFARGFPRIGAAVTAARAASRLTDARLAQVFDVQEDRDHAYVVTEWVAGDSLEDLLADGPLDPGQGAEIIAQSAEALAVAHAAGVAHLCLTPARCGGWPACGVKITGLGVDAALAGVTDDAPALADTRSLGKLLYGALTAHWPGGDWPSLPPAPTVDGHPCSPRQVRAGVPAGHRQRRLPGALPARGRWRPAGDNARHAGDGAEPGDTRTRRATRRPPRRLRHSARPAPGTAYPPYDGATRGWGRDTVAGRGLVASRVTASIAALLVAAAVGAGVWTLGHPGASSATRPPATPGKVAVDLLTPVAAHGFDPLSSVAADPGNENADQAQFAIDGSPTTAWHTQYYVGSPRFGGLKAGTGLILDMGKRVSISSVKVTFGQVPGANVRIEVGNNDTRAPGTLRTFTIVAHRNDIGGIVRFTAHGAPRGRFVLIWFTKLPPRTAGPASQFEAEIFSITVRGSS